MSLTPDQKRKLKDVFNDAVNHHPTPDSPVMRVGPLRMSPRQLAHELENETPIGKYFFRMIESTVNDGGIPFDAVVAQFRRKPPKP